ncbi:WD40 repeat-like protein [Ramaria rubella]|nr:WD40 repeat-like protein [Ramaria rubella]
METGSSTTAQEPLHELPRKERKPRHRLKKGKEREEGGQVAQTEATELTAATLREEIPVEDAPAWAWTPLADASVSNRPPVFTKDCRYFFVIAGSSVKIYATATGQVVSTLSSSSSGSASSSSQLGDGHTDEITAAFINPRNAFQLMTASLDGRIKIWDFLDAALLSTIEVGEPITHMCAHENVRDHIFVATASRKKTKKNNANALREQSKVYRVSLRPSRATTDLPIHKPADMIKVGKMRPTTGLAISPSGTWLVATGGPKAYVCPMVSVESGFTKFVSNETLTCLAFHPSEEYFATGDQKGQIRLWYCLNHEQISTRSQGERRAQTTTLHWHAHSVSSIAFTANGSYLLSGGEEAVLVIWQLHTGKREFVPRLGAPIVSVSVASHQSVEEEYLLGLSDGTLAFVGSGTLRVSRSFARIKHDPTYQLPGKAPLAVHSRTSTIILPSSHPSSLLVYAPLTSTLIAELEVSPSNRVSRRDEKPIEPSRVERVVVSEDGQWLATIDGRDGGEDFERETYLKVWRWDAASTTWNLNSRIDRPHGVHHVNALLFARAGEHPFLISAGADGSVKVWRIRTIPNKKGEQEIFWICRSSLEYRSQIPTQAVCSPDGSLLAVSYGRHVVIYELSNNALRMVLTCPELQEVFTIAFVGSCGRYIVVGGRTVVVVWDLVLSTVLWCHVLPERIYDVVPHHTDESFVVMYHGEKSSTMLRKFGVVSANPVASHTLPFMLRTIVWYPYAASGNGFSFLGITQKGTSVVFGDRINFRQEEGSMAREISAESNPLGRNLFQDIFGASAFQDFTSQPPVMPPSIREDASAGPWNPTNPLRFPSHILPPLHMLFTPLLESVLRKRDVQPPETVEEQEPADIEDVVMEDAPSPTGVSAGRVWRNEEMEEFVELFKEETFSSRKNNTTPSHKSVNGNGVTKAVNGIHHSKESSSVPHTPPSINGKNHAPKDHAHDSSDSSPAIVGKKRKKSMA